MPNVEFTEKEVTIVANNIERSDISLVKRAASMLKSLNRERQSLLNQSAEQEAKISSLEAQLEEKDAPVKTSILTKIISEIEALENTFQEKYGEPASTASCIQIIRSYLPKQESKSDEQRS